PGDVEAACRAAAVAGVKRALSIAAGVPLAKLEDWLGAGVPVVRAMPNTPALVGAGAAAVAAGTHAGEEELAWAEDILGSVGVVVRVGEPLLDAVTGLSGSGPAYLFLVAEALIEAGVLAGLPGDARRALRQRAGRPVDDAADEGLGVRVVEGGGRRHRGAEEQRGAGLRGER